MTRARQGAGLRRCSAWVAAVLAVTWAAGASAADRIRIEIDGVDGAIRDNVRGYLALTRFAQRDDLTDAQVRRLADRAVDEAADALRPFGYYAPTVKSRTSWDDPQWIVRLKIKPGEPVLMESVQVQISGPGSTEPALVAIAPASRLQIGARSLAYRVGPSGEQVLTIPGGDRAARRRLCRVVFSANKGSVVCESEDRTDLWR